MLCIAYRPDRKNSSARVDRNGAKFTVEIFSVGSKSHSKLLTSSSDRFPLFTVSRGQRETYPVLQDRSGAVPLRGKNRGKFLTYYASTKGLFHADFKPSDKTCSAKVRLYFISFDVKFHRRFACSKIRFLNSWL